jgi:VacB/RNase II family 3'-5' exoribonuclease
MAEFDIQSAARRAMTDSGFPTVFPSGIESAATAVVNGASRDLRELIWSSIDNRESRDLDQVEVAEARSDGTVHVLVGIADVDAFVPRGSALDLAAAERALTVYTGIENFPMLPPSLSEYRSSLVVGEDRPAVVTEILVGPDGAVRSYDVYLATLQNHAKLAYEDVSDWLSGSGAMPPAAEGPGVEVQLRVQDVVSAHLRAMRRRAGALDFETVEARPILENGKVTGLTVPQRGRARFLIENFMIAANTSVSGFLRDHNFPSIQRVVRKPARWARIVDVARTLGYRLPLEPDSSALAAFLSERRDAEPLAYVDLSTSIVKLLGPGEYTVVEPGGAVGEHFGLAVSGYTHSTAPNRRYIDLVTQRLLKAAVSGTMCPYSIDELQAIAARSNDRARAAARVERMVRKTMAAVMLSSRIGDAFEAIVTGVKPSGTYIRLLAPPVEGRLSDTSHDLDVGDRLRVRLVHTDPACGFVDFEVRPGLG